MRTGVTEPMRRIREEECCRYYHIYKKLFELDLWDNFPDFERLVLALLLQLEDDLALRLAVSLRQVVALGRPDRTGHTSLDPKKQLLQASL